MSAQISRSAKALSCRCAQGCNDPVTGRARSAIINAQLEAGACPLMERQQQRLAAPRTRRSQLVRYLRFVSHADAPNCESRSAPKLRLLGLAPLPEIPLVEPQKPVGQLPQVISSVTDRQFAGPAQRVCGLPPKGRDRCIRGALHG